MLSRIFKKCFIKNVTNLGFLKLQMFNVQMILNLKGVRQLHLRLFSIFHWPVLFDILAFWGNIKFKFQRRESFVSKATECAEM